MVLLYILWLVCVDTINFAVLSKIYTIIIYFSLFSIQVRELEVNGLLSTETTFMCCLLLVSYEFFVVNF